MKVALVGIGKIALDQHVPALTASPDWELAATVSRHGTVEGVEAFTGIHHMLEARPDIAVVSFVPAAGAALCRRRRRAAGGTACHAGKAPRRIAVRGA